MSITTIVCTLHIFEKNAEVIERTINNPKDKVKLATYDRLTFWSFVLGVVVFCILGIFTGSEKLNKGNTQMTSENKSVKPVSQSSTSDKAYKSLDGIEGLAPNTTTTTTITTTTTTTTTQTQEQGSSGQSNSNSNQPPPQNKTEK